MDSPGYLSADYGRSFSAFGEIVTLPHSGLQLIKRGAGNGYFDLSGVYPFSMCRDWRKLADDRGFLEDTGAVAVVLVGDPFATPIIRDVCSGWTVNQRFKTHCVVELSADWRSMRRKRLRTYANSSLRLQTVELVADCREYSKMLWELYQNTIRRHNVSGIQRLSQSVIAQQLEIPGVNLFVASDDTETTGALMAFRHGETANFHLLFLTDRAYKLKTSYALIQTMLEEFENQGIRYVNLGGAAGPDDKTTDGLFRFKSGWTRDFRQSVLCGNILDQKAYFKLTEKNTSGRLAYFPAYRALPVNNDSVKGLS